MRGVACIAIRSVSEIVKCLGTMDIDMSSVGERVLLMLECVLASLSFDLEMLVSSVASGLVGIVLIGGKPAGWCWVAC